MNGDTDERVYRGAPFRISARTYNALMEVLRDWRKSRPGRGAAGGTNSVDPRLTVFVRNATGSAKRALSVLAIGDVVGSPTGRKLDFNARPVFEGGTPLSSDAAIVITQEPAAGSDAQGNRVVRGCVSGVTLCRVLVTDSAHEWANPVAGVNGYLKSSADAGQARILWSGTSEISGDTGAGIKLCAVYLIGSKPETTSDESGYGESGEDSGATACDKYRVRCSDGYLISEICNPETLEWEYDTDLGLYCGIGIAAGSTSSSGVISGESGGEEFPIDFGEGPLEFEVVTKVCPIRESVEIPAGAQGEPGEPGEAGAPGAPAVMTATAGMSSATIGTGSKTLSYSSVSNLGWIVGMRLRASAVSAPTNFMEGQITAVSAVSVTINVTYTSGSGTYVAWTIGVAGEVGATGASGPTFPSGFLGEFAGTVAPAGWLVCDGSAVSRTTYADLFAAINTSWGAGDGSTTFNLPNLTRRVTVGAGGAGSAALGNTVGSLGGAEMHTLTAAELPAHTHTVPGLLRSASVTANGAGFERGESGVPNGDMASGSAGSGNAHNNLQPSAVVLRIIKI